jgi:hypothetical protein
MLVGAYLSGMVAFGMICEGHLSLDSLSNPDVKPPTGDRNWKQAPLFWGKSLHPNGYLPAYSEKHRQQSQLWRQQNSVLIKILVA